MITIKPDVGNWVYIDGNLAEVYWAFADFVKRNKAIEISRTQFRGHRVARMVENDHSTVVYIADRRRLAVCKAPLRKLFLIVPRTLYWRKVKKK